MIGKAGAQESGRIVRALQRRRSVDLEPGPARDAQSAFAVRGYASVHRHVPDHRDACVGRRDSLGRCISIDIVVSNESDRTHVSDLGRHVLGDVMTEEIDADGEARNVNRLDLKSRLKLSPGEQVADRADIDGEVRVGQERGVLRPRVFGSRLLGGCTGHHAHDDSASEPATPSHQQMPYSTKARRVAWLECHARAQQRRARRL